jgi:hypothetical protein
MPAVAAVKTRPVSMALYPRNRLEKDRDDERRAHQKHPLDVLSDQAEVGRAVTEQSQGDERLRAGPLARADVEDEPEQEGGSDCQEHRHEHEVVVGQQDPEHHEEHADGRQDRSDSVEWAGWVGSDGIDDAAAEEGDYRYHADLEEERRAS